MAGAPESPTNPFRYGALALDEAFTDREAELAELIADARNGQDVVILAPRRLGKTSLLWRAASELVRRRVLVAQVDLMSTPTPARFAEKLARAIHDDLAGPVSRARERVRVFAGLRVTPTVTVDPEDGSLSFGFDASAPEQDLHATIERLLELPGQLAAERMRKVVLVLDEFQEVTAIDPQLPRLMRSVFQRQPEVAHVYLGSRRDMMERIFDDSNEPFWRSAKQMELGLIAPEHFRDWIPQQFHASRRAITTDAVEAILAVTGGHPYATQELCYFTWQETNGRTRAAAAHVARALTKVLRSEHAHFSLLWQGASPGQRTVLQALSHEPGPVLSSDYRRRRGLSAASSVQRSLEALERNESVARSGSSWRIAEPFLAEWIARTWS